MGNILRQWLTLLLISGFLCSGDLLAQKPDSNALAPAAGISDAGIDLENQLISLDSIIEIALKNSPYLKHDSVMIDAERYDIKLAKRRWHNNVTGFANYASGNQRLVLAGSNNGQNNILNGYRYGVNVNIPLSDFTARKFQIKRTQAEYNASMYKKEETEMQLRRQVIEEYNRLIAAQKILKIKTSAKENLGVLQQLGEKQFREGSTSLEAYASVSDMAVKAEAEFELAKSNFRSTYLQFEDLVGVDLISLMKKR
ncbi:MAG: TolC family protein [Cytophagaceae bacterium]|nr:TolC family protein [Cytophagaceae bacterium]